MKRLLAVNAGSNTVTSFVVDGARLTRLQTVPSGGVFPVSLTAGHDRLFVLNAGGSGSVTGYRINASGRLAVLPGASRDLGLSNDVRPEFFSAPCQARSLALCGGDRLEAVARCSEAVIGAAGL